jgi:hypothetical protein
LTRQASSLLFLGGGARHETHTRDGANPWLKLEQSQVNELKCTLRNEEEKEEEDDVSLLE